jgi:hypothetical protein
MVRSNRVAGLVAALAFAASGCNSTAPGGPPAPTDGKILVLNSLSKTISQFNVSENELVAFGNTFTLPANYDGVSFDVLGNLFVSTISAVGGSQVVWGNVETGDLATTGFPGANGALADPGKATLVIDVQSQAGALVPARAENAIYVAFPGQPTAALISSDAGEFVERVLPFGDVLFAVDANLDDVGETWAPLGDARMKIFRVSDGAEVDDFELTGVKNASEAFFSFEEIFTLAGGTFTPAFKPAGDGNLLVVNAPGRGVVKTLALGGNGLALEPGRNGLAYIVRTNAGDFDSTDILTLNLSSSEFVRGPTNAIQPKNSDGSDLKNCRVASSLVDGRILCATFEAGTQGRLVLMDANGNFLDDAPVGAGAVDIFIRP